MNKYYILSKIIAVMLLFGLILSPVGATVLDSAGGYPYKSFACQEILITANFSISTPDIVYADIYIGQNPQIREHGVTISQSHNLTMSNIGGNRWTGIWGNDENIHWGQRNIIFNAYTGETLEQFGANNVVFIMNSECTGTGKTNYTQMKPSGVGSRLGMLWTYAGNDFLLFFLQWALFPWIEVWGYLFYVLLMLMITISIYMKSQNIISPLIASLIMLMFAAAANIVPVEYRQWIMMLIGICFGIIYVKFFMRD